MEPADVIAVVWTIDMRVDENYMDEQGSKPQLNEFGYDAEPPEPSGIGNFIGYFDLDGSSGNALEIVVQLGGRDFPPFWQGVTFQTSYGT